MTQSLALSLPRGVVKCPLIHGFPVASCQYVCNRCTAEEPPTCIRPDQSFALDLTGMLAENNHCCRSRQATTGQQRPFERNRYLMHRYN